MNGWRPLAVVCAVAVAGCSGGDAAPATAGCAPSPFRNTPPLVIAHAGGEGLAPANSLLAMELWMSSDGVVVHITDLAGNVGAARVDGIDAGLGQPAERSSPPRTPSPTGR